MKFQRFLPFVLILALLGGAGYIANENPEWFLDEHEVRVREAYEVLVDSIESDLIHMKGDTSAWSELIAMSYDVLANDTLRQKTDFSFDISNTAWTNWSAAFDAWRASGKLSSPPNVRLNELELLLAEGQALAGKVNDIQQHRSTMNAGSRLFDEGPYGIVARTRRLMNKPWPDCNYDELSRDLEEWSDDFSENRQFKNAQYTLYNQRTCHLEIHQQQELLLSVALVQPGDSRASLPRGFDFQRSFTCGTTYVLEDFPHYFKQGRDLTQWETRLW